MKKINLIASERSSEHVEVKGVNLSDGGMCFDVDNALIFDLKFEHEGKVHMRNARLIWMERLSEERFRLGFKFVKSES